MSLRTLMVWGGLLAVAAAAGAGRTARARDGVVAGVVEVDRGQYDKGPFVFLENDFLRLEFDPSRGGRCRRFLVKDGERELCQTIRHSGMFVDHWAKYPWPSGLFERPYQYEVIDDGPDRKSVRLWIVAPGGTGKKRPLQGDDDPGLRDLKVQKTVTLFADKPFVEVESALLNPTDENRAAGLYEQQAFVLDGDRAWDCYYFPSVRGVDVLENFEPKARAKGRNWVHDPVAGWIAARDSKTDHGLVFLLDYNYLQKMYSCGSTAEWWYDNVLLPKGKGWTTRYSVIPVDGFKGFTHASERLIGDVRFGADAKTLALTLAGSKAPLGKVEISLSVEDVRSEASLGKGEATLTVDRIARPVSATVALDRAIKTDVVIRATVAGDGWSETFENYTLPPGTGAEKEAELNRGALGGASASPYSRPRPPKVKTMDKPDLDKIPIARGGPLNVLLCFGLYTNHYRIDKAVAAFDGSTLKVSNAPPSGVDYFPGTYEELFQYHAIVLSNINARALGDFGMEMIADYVRQGGGLIVLGGPYAYGAAEFAANCPLRDVLPIEIGEPFDMRWPGVDKGWALEAVEASHPIVAGVDFAEAPMAYWTHEAKPKANATVVLRTGDYPAAVAGAAGKGRVVAFTLTPQGAPAEGQTPFWETQAWQNVLVNSLRWLNGEK